MKTCYRTLSLCLSLLLVCLPLAACSSEQQQTPPDSAVSGAFETGPSAPYTAADAYQEQTDYPYLDVSWGNAVAAASAENGVYFILGDFLWFWDAQSGQTVPLCHKPECRHNKLPEEEMWKCGAYLRYNCEQHPFLQYYQGSLYCITEFAHEGEKVSMSDETYLTRISPDGVHREQLCPIDLGSEMSTELIHRGYLYLGVRVEAADAEGVKKTVFELRRVSMDALDKEPETLLQTNQLNPDILPYGDHLYISGETYDEATGDSGSKVYDYSIKTGRVTELLDNKYLLGVQQDRLLYREPITEEAEKSRTEVTVYAYDLKTGETSEAVVLPKEEDRYLSVFADETYFYSFDFGQSTGGDDGMTFTVYDKSGKLLSEEKAPCRIEAIYFSPGGDYGYLMDRFAKDEGYAGTIFTMYALNKADGFSFQKLLEGNMAELSPMIRVEEKVNT